MKGKALTHPLSKGLGLRDTRTARIARIVYTLTLLLRPKTMAGTPQALTSGPCL